MSDPRRKAIVRLRIAIWACAILLFAIQFVHQAIGLFLPAMALALVLLAAAIQQGVVLLTCGTYGNVIRFLPPLAISDELLNEGLDIVWKALTDAE